MNSRMNGINKKIMIAISKLSGGGAERVVSIWANQLANRGYDVIIALSYPTDNEYNISHIIKKTYIAESEEKYKELSTYEKVHFYRELLKNECPNAIITFLFSIQVYITIANIGLPCVKIDTVRINPWYAMKEKRIIARMLWKICFNTADVIITQNSEQISFFGFRNRKKCVIVPNPISDYYLTHYKEEVPSSIMNFMAAGRIDPQKNYEMMIDGFAKAKARHPGIILRIFGEGDKQYEQRIKKQIVSKGIDDSIILMGRTSDIEGEYLKHDALLLTSHYEGMPNVLIEAMASRLICISTNCKTGPKDLIENGINGFLIDVGDEDGLSECITRVIEMTQLERESMMNNARDVVVRNCSQESSINKLCEILDALHV